MTGFSYMLEKGPTDFFWWAMDIKDMIERIRSEGTLKADKYAKELSILPYFIKYQVYLQSNEEPHTIKFFAIPDDYHCQICAIAKIQNNGTTYIFSDDYKFLKTISSEGNKIHTILGKRRHEEGE